MKFFFCLFFLSIYAVTVKFRNPKVNVLSKTILHLINTIQLKSAVSTVNGKQK